MKGHIHVHETGAVEATGHKVLTCPHQGRKLTINQIEKIINAHTDEHMVQPAMSIYLRQQN